MRCHTLDRKEIDEKLNELEKQIIKSYYNTSIIDRVCTLHPVSEEIDGTYEQFAGKYLIERSHITDPSHFLILNELGTSLANSETKFLIKQFTTNTKTEIDTFSVEKIKEKMFEIKSKEYFPNMVFIPINYFHDVYDWNKVHKPYGSAGSIFDRLYFDRDNSLQVKYSNKKIKFNDIIITSKEVNHWSYRPDKETQERIKAKFDWDMNDTENSLLLVKTVFKFSNENKEGNAVIKIKDFEESSE